MSGPTKSLILGIDANSYRPLLDAVHTMATKYEQHIATFKGYVDKPGGTAWEGQTAEAGQANAADGWKVAARIQDIDTKFQTTAGMAVDHTIVPELTNCQHMIENIEAQRNKGLTLSEDLQVGYNRPPGISDELAAENAKVAEARGKELKESARKWWQAEQEVKHLAEGTVRDIENEVNGAAGTFDIGKAVKDTAPGKPDKAQDGNFYKDWYPKKTDPASVDPGTGTLADSVDRIKNPPTTPTAATAPVDPNAPQYGPFAKDAIDKTKLGGLGESLTYINRNDKPPEEHKPSAAERFKSDISEGIDRGVDKLIAPITDLRDRLGLGDKGFWEANEEAGRREWESFKHQMTTPPIVDTAEGIKHNIENPGQYVGERMVEGGALMAGGPEGMLPRAGLEGSAAHLGSMHPDLPAPGALHDTPAPTTHHIDDTTPGHHPAPGGDHTPTVGDHSAPSTGDHSWDFAVDSNGHYVPGSLPSYEQLKGLTQTDPNTAHFWSGRDAGGVGVGPDGSGIAERIAEGVGGGTLETTLVKNGVDPLPVWNRHDPVSVQFWEDASRAYAENTNGEVTAVIGSDLRPGNIWQTVEIPRLMDNPGVTKIVQIDPDTGKSTVIFSRDK
ncbi:Uncharacterised protein [Mycobacteroides abscessus subsp. bolletii]|nr:Uncharacterised protein [Mycobacteroides abscessus subsp. bolletii]